MNASPTVWSRVGGEDPTSHAERTAADWAEVSEAMEAFAADRAQMFFPGSREQVLGQLFEFACNEESAGYLCLSGESGSGKSTILGYLVQQLLESTPTNLAVISHFVGATTRSSSTLETVQRLSEQLVTLSGTDVDLPHDLDELILEFPRLLRGGMRCD